MQVEDAQSFSITNWNGSRETCRFGFNVSIFILAFLTCSGGTYWTSKQCFNVFQYQEIICTHCVNGHLWSVCLHKASITSWGRCSHTSRVQLWVGLVSNAETRSGVSNRRMVTTIVITNQIMNTIILAIYLQCPVESAAFPDSTYS